MKRIKKLNHGFTLVETLVAISIFTFSVLGLLSVLAQGISNDTYARQKMTATYLAQEGIEYIRNMRDTYVLYDSVNPTTGWAAFKARLSGVASCNGTNGCYYDDRNINYANHSQLVWVNSLILTACSSSTCPNGALLYDSTTGKYGYASGASSGFIRKIKVVVGGDVVTVTSTVTWTQGSGSYSIVFSDRLLNWIE